MIHPHFVFWLVAPVGLVILWYATLTRIGYLLAVVLLYAVVILANADYSASPSWRELASGVLVTVAPFAAVLGVALAGWAFLRRLYWLPLLAFPVAFYVGFSVAVMLDMATSIVHS